MRALQHHERASDGQARMSLGKILTFAAFGLVFAWWCLAGVAILAGWPEATPARTTFEHWEKFLDWGNSVLLAGFLMYGTKTIQTVLEKKNGGKP